MMLTNLPEGSLIAFNYPGMGHFGLENKMD